MQIRSLRSKVNLSIFITAVVIALVFGAILYPFERDRYKTEIKQIGLLLESVLQQRMEDLANELYADQRRALIASLEEICRVDGMVAASIYLPDGRHYASTKDSLARHMESAGWDGLDMGDSMSTTSFENRKLLVLSKAVKVIGTEVGKVRLYYDLSDLEDEILFSSLFFIILLTTVIVVMVLILNILLSHLVLEPISALQEAIGRVEAGKLGETVHLMSDDEIGQVGDAFNAMSVRLASSQTALKETEQMYRSIFENAVEGIFQSSAEEGRFLTLNRSMARILGYDSPEDMLSKVQGIAGELYVNPEDQLEFHRALRRDGHVIGFETRMLRKDQSAVWVSLSARCVRDETGEVVYYEGSLTDMSERRERVRAERDREAAQAASKAKSEFLANMSHEIRTPMNAVLGFTELLTTMVTDPLQRSYLESIDSSSRCLMALISDILDLSKIEAGRMELRLESVNLRSLALEIGRVFTAQMHKKGIDFIVNLDPSLPDGLMLDGVRLRQVLLNLVGNALKFTDSGSITLSAEGDVAKTHPERFHLKITVEDTGIGIRPEDHDVIFESFAQLHGSGSRSAGGTGLGLTISKSLVEMMGGSLSVRSVPGKGSLFEIHLPGVALAVGNDTTPVAERLTLGKPALRKATVLVADDLPVNRDLIKGFVKGQDIAIVEAEDGRSAVQMARACRPDLILMDLRMPVMDGYAAMDLLRSDPATRSIPLVALTALGMKEERDRIQAAGFDGFLIRPFERSSFYDTLFHFIGEDSKPDGEDLKGSWCGSPADLVPSDFPERVEILLERLRGDLTTEWLAAKNRQHMPDIEAFARQVKDLGDHSSVRSLSAYGEDLLFHVSVFDVDGIMTLLEYYPELVARIEESGRSHHG